MYSCKLTIKDTPEIVNTLILEKSLNTYLNFSILPVHKARKGQTVLAAGHNQ